MHVPLFQVHNSYGTSQFFRYALLHEHVTFFRHILLHSHSPFSFSRNILLHEHVTFFRYTLHHEPIAFFLFPGTHYFMNMSRSLPCEKIYPLFLMYDMEGKLGAFGWVFQGRPSNFYSEDSQTWFHLTPATYPVSCTPS